jgi:hypothetical protein
MSLKRNKCDVLKGVQMLEKEEDKDEYKVSALLQHLRPKEEKPGGWTCRKRTCRLFSMIISYTHTHTHTHTRKRTYRLSNNLYAMQDSRK